MEPKVIKIDDVEYIKKDNMIVVESAKYIASAAVGMKVIVRSHNEVVNAGIVECADETGVILKNARRLWYHKPVKGSWYDGIATFGIHEDSEVSTTVERKFIVEDYSLTTCTEEAFKSIMEKVPNGE